MEDEYWRCFLNNFRISIRMVHKRLGFTVKSARSLNLSINVPVQYLDGWALKNKRYYKKPEVYTLNEAKANL